jgi:hypothetical protein
MRKSAVVLLSTLLPLSLLSLNARNALAQDDADATAPPPAAAPPPPPPPPPGAVLVPVQEEPELKQYVIEVNPLATIIGRWSIQGEYLPAVHHAITLNPFYTHAGVAASANGTGVDLGSLSGFGGELGYRFYTGRKGPNGFFVGPSFLFASYSASGGVNLDGSTGGSSSFTSVGGAIDIGGQGVIGPGVVVGGGFGLQWTKTSRTFETTNFNVARDIIASGGTWPRFLFTVGYAF